MVATGNIMVLLRAVTEGASLRAFADRSDHPWRPKGCGKREREEVMSNGVFREP